MAHNGALHPQDRLGDLVTPAWQPRLVGTTDSERYFLHVMSRLEEHPGDLIWALDAGVAAVGGGREVDVGPGIGGRRGQGAGVPLERRHDVPERHRGGGLAAQARLAAR